MRSRRYLVIGLCLAGTAAALAAQPKASAPGRSFPRTVYLGSAAAVEQLRVTHPRDYARVRRILASADELCKAGQPKLLLLKGDVQDFGCPSLIFTSYPPQRQITFRLEDTRYIAMIFLKGARGKLTPARLTQARGSTTAVAAQASRPAR